MKYLSKIFLLFVLSLFIMIPLRVTAHAADSSSDIVKINEDIHVPEGEVVSGNVVNINGDIYIDGTVSGNAVSLFGDIIVNGRVTGDAVSVRGSINVSKNGKVFGNTVEVLGGNVSARRIFPANVFVNPLGKIPQTVLSFFRTLAWFLLVSLIYVIIPDKTNEMANTIEPNLGKRFGIGILAAICSPIAMIIATIALIITIIGIIAVPFLWIAYLIAALVGAVPVYIFIGKKLAGLTGNKNITAYASLAVGLFIVWLVKTIFTFGGIFVSWINIFISLSIFSLGLGTLLDYFTTKRRMKKAARGDYIPQGGYSPQGGGYNPEGQDNGPGQNRQQQGNDGHQNNEPDNDDKTPNSENK